MKTLIISQSFIIRESLESLFSNILNSPNIKCIRKIHEVKEEELKQQKLIFIEVEEDTQNIMNILKSIKTQSKSIKIIILDRKQSQSNFKLALKIGIDGYITSITEKEDFIFIINKIVEGHKLYSPDLLQTVISKNYMNNKDTLTNREKDVLKEVGKGITNKQISENLHITECTVKKHVGNILDKLQLKNRQEIILYIKHEQ